MSRSARLACLLPATLLAVLALAGDNDTAPVKFEEALIQDRYGYAFGITAADLDGDRDLDLVSSDTVNDRLFWFQNDGHGKFTQHLVMKGEPGWFERNAVGDIDGDGKPDIAVVKNLHGHLVWFRNSGTPADGKLWERRVISTDFKRAYDVTLVDLDADGDLDAAASAWVGNYFAWFENAKPLEGAEWAKHVIEENVGETRTIRAADFNHDGKPDLLGSGRTANLVAWYENSGKPKETWAKHVIDDRTPLPCQGQPADLDGDGDTDVIMAFGLAGAGGGEAAWYENVGSKGQGTEWKKHAVGALPAGCEVAYGDFDGDRDQDIAATSWNASAGAANVVWFENAGRGETWKPHVLKENWPRANSVIVADLDGDQRLDIAACAERGSNELRWWRNLGK